MGSFQKGASTEEILETLGLGNCSRSTNAISSPASVDGHTPSISPYGPRIGQYGLVAGPCQPFSAAGRRLGIADQRHLWPHWFHLIEECHPATIFGEQVASKDGLAWLDLVQADLEAADYAFGAADLCAAGVGSPHIRQRLYWVADAEERRWQRCPDQSARLFPEIM